MEFILKFHFQINKSTKINSYVMTALHNAAENGNFSKTKASKLSFWNSTKFQKIAKWVKNRKKETLKVSNQ